MAGSKERLTATLDGGSLVPVLTHNGTGTVKRPHDDFIVHFPHYDKDPLGPGSAIILGDYKLIRTYETGGLRLYDLSKDLGEHSDIAVKMPERTADLDKHLSTYLATVKAQMPAPNSNHDPANPDDPVPPGKRGGRKNEKPCKPFCAGPGVTDKDDSLRAGLALIPFDDELNRLTRKITSPKATAYDVTWGEQKKRFTAEQLTAGVNLAKEFDANPLVPAFQKVRDAVTKKQTYETRQIKELAHVLEGAADIDATFALTEKVREPLEKAVLSPLQPVEHALTSTAAKD